jgi:hypothetical protein
MECISLSNLTLRLMLEKMQEQALALQKIKGDQIEHISG